MRRFRLLSLIVAMLTAGPLLGLNLRGEYRSWEVMLVNCDIGTWDYGFPRPAIRYSATIYGHGSEYLIEINGQNTESMVPQQHGWLYISDRIFEFNRSALALDALILIGAPGLALFACEYFLRRRDARAKPVASA